MNQFFLNTAESKRLIAKGIVARTDVREALANHTVVIVAGTTNGYVAEEILQYIGNEHEFNKYSFFRGITKSPGIKRTTEEVKGDVVIEKGKWSIGKSIYNVADKLKQTDIIFKGANAVHLPSREAGVIVGNPTSGTIGPIIAAVVGRRASLIIPVGVEKRVDEPIPELARLCNSPGALGFRLCPSPGTIFTELDAIRLLTKAEPHILASGGVCGKEGGCYIMCEGTKEQLAECSKLIREVSGEPAFYI